MIWYVTDNLLIATKKGESNWTPSACVSCIALQPLMWGVNPVARSRMCSSLHYYNPLTNKGWIQCEKRSYPSIVVAPSRIRGESNTKYSLYWTKTVVAPPYTRGTSNQINRAVCKSNVVAPSHARGESNIGLWYYLIKKITSKTITNKSNQMYNQPRLYEIISLAIERCLDKGDSGLSG